MPFLRNFPALSPQAQIVTLPQAVVAPLASAGPDTLRSSGCKWMTVGGLAVSCAQNVPVRGIACNYMHA
jgi:hypothetical protein